MKFRVEFKLSNAPYFTEWFDTLDEARTFARFARESTDVTFVAIEDENWDEVSPEAVTFQVSQDGDLLATLNTEDEAYQWLLKHQGQSTEYALRYGGYAITAVTTA